MNDKFRAILNYKLKICVIRNNCCPVKLPTPPDLSVSLLFSKAKKVGQKCLCTITAFGQPADPDQSTKRRDQDPKCNPAVVLQTLQD
jgi:hypothetical protein